MSKHQSSDTDDSDSSPEDAAIAKTKKMLTNNRDAARLRQKSKEDIEMSVSDIKASSLERKLEERDEVSPTLYQNPTLAN